MTQAQIQHIFQQRYNHNTWKQFLGQAFINARLLSKPEELSGINRDVALEAFKLGYILLDEEGIERQIAIYEVVLAEGIVLERNRVGLRNLLRKYWKNIDAAFIAYYNPGNTNWRFTYVSELSGFDAEGELISIKTEPKRYTYILGEGETCRTAAERFALLIGKGKNVSLDDIKDAFSVEKLSKAFFEEYKKQYEDFVEFLTGKRIVRIDGDWKELKVHKANPQLAYIFNGDEKLARDFCKKLLGRIVFLFFIQKKGWLGVPIKSEWGNGNKNFIFDLFDKCRNKGTFYSDFLARLFFEALNTQRKSDIIELINGEQCRIPYLNGGLFEEENKKFRNLIFPEQLFQNLFSFFNQYNFTIYEDDPNDHTIAVDPEMLGHIFENLLEDNKDKGAFYTPKEIVHFMCQESLIEYLDVQVQTKDKELKIARPAIEKLIKFKEVTEDIRPHISFIDKLLISVKICDPAIGSGAFPMGLLHEIFATKQTLYSAEHGSIDGFNGSAVKLNTIQNSIYGVDIEKGAVDIARLRFWLSLIVDEPEPKALPNLDYKIVVGNSLVSKFEDNIIDVDWSLNNNSHGLFGQDLVVQKSDLLRKISNKQKEYFNPEIDKKKQSSEIRNLKIDLLVTQIELMIKKTQQEEVPAYSSFKDKKHYIKATEQYNQTLGWKNQIIKLKQLKTKPEEPLHFFDWRLDFPEVMNEQVAEKVGFDIIIANPPYDVYQGEKKKEIEGLLGFEIYHKCQGGKINAYELFLAKTHTLLSNSGINCQISLVSTKN